MHNLLQTAGGAQRGQQPWLLADSKGTQLRTLGRPEESGKRALPSTRALRAVLHTRLRDCSSKAQSQRTTKVGPEVFVVSHGEVLKSREGCCVTAVQVGYETLGAAPGDTNTRCYA